MDLSNYIRLLMNLGFDLQNIQAVRFNRGISEITSVVRFKQFVLEWRLI
jgi:hypothetical protein